MSTTETLADAGPRQSAFGAVVAAFDTAVRRWLPDPFVIVLILTVVVFACGVAFTDRGPVGMVDAWGEGFWNLLQFAMQMMLVLVTGYVLASTPPFQKGMGALASLASTPGQAIVMVTLVALVASWINWGFGLVIGALFARQLGRAVPSCDYRLLIASAYSGFIVWHGGISGSVPLTAATEGNFLADRIGLIPTSETIFAPFNLIIVAAVAIVLPVMNRLMLSHGAESVRAGDVDLGQEAAAEEAPATTPAEKLERSRVLGVAVALLGLAYVVYYFWQNGFELDLNIVNFTFLFLGLLLFMSPKRFLDTVFEAVKGAGGILIQFPFYAGIMGMMIGSGMAESVSNWFVSFASQTTLPAITFLAAGFVNVLVPSGGGQWAVQGPVMMPAAEALGADQARVAMAVAWGDAWTNLIQPFWALPALAIAGLSARDIMGFCLMLLVATGVVIALGLTFLP
ncbi:MAG: short-chain fatty acid transporter [Paracoccaceae bacterium]